jgi:hypothetical protein
MQLSNLKPYFRREFDASTGADAPRSANYYSFACLIFFGNEHFPVLLIVVPVLLMTSAEYCRFRFSRKVEMGWEFLGLLLFTSTLYCSMLYGVGRLVAIFWSASE